MPNANKAPKSKRLHRSDPPRAAPNRSGKDHVRRNATPSDDDSPPGRTEERSEWIAGAVQKSVAGVVNLGYEVIERQIQEGRLAAERLRAGLATSTQLNADVNNLVEGFWPNRYHPFDGGHHNPNRHVRRRRDGKQYYACRSSEPARTAGDRSNGHPSATRDAGFAPDFDAVRTARAPVGGERPAAGSSNRS
jgi:hypothetical protein